MDMDVVERHLLLGLRLGRHIEGLVDAYYGPPELAERVRSEHSRAGPNTELVQPSDHDFDAWVSCD